MTRIEKKVGPNARVPLNITVSKELYDWVTKQRGLASKLAEQTFAAVKNDLIMNYGHDSLIIKLDKNTARPDSNAKYY